MKLAEIVCVMFTLKAHLLLLHFCLFPVIFTKLKINNLTMNQYEKYIMQATSAHL